MERNVKHSGFLLGGVRTFSTPPKPNEVIGQNTAYYCKIDTSALAACVSTCLLLTNVCQPVLPGDLTVRHLSRVLKEVWGM